METVLDLGRYPVDRLDTAEGGALVSRCREELAREGMFNLEGLVRAEAVARAAAELQPLIDGKSFTHRRRHNVYFRKEVPGLDKGHPVLAELETVNHTLCGDQLRGTVVDAIYEWAPLADFLAAVMEIERLHLMDDPLARVNVMGYRAGESLNWHFDRSQFTTTLLIQAPEAGGEFQYRRDLRAEDAPNYEGVARVLSGEDDTVRTLRLAPGTLNVFKGRNTLHRVSPPKGGRDRIIAVFSYYDRPGVRFSDEERIGFYGRAA